MNKQERVALEAEMNAHIQAWQQSDQSQLRYCRENNLTYHKFVYWLNKIRRKQNPIDQVFIPVGDRKIGKHSQRLHLAQGIQQAAAGSGDHKFGKLSQRLCLSGSRISDLKSQI